MMHYQRGKNRDQVFMTGLEQIVESDSWVRVVDLFVDAIPIGEFGFKNSTLNKEGNLPFHPSDMFKLLLYGYRKRIRSANKLHEATKINVEVMWLMKGLRPSARKICYFRSQNTEAIEKAHRYFVKLLKSWALIDGSVVAVDGTKVKAQNSLKNNFNQKKIDRHLEYIDNKIGDYLDQIEDLEKSKYSPQTKKKKISQIEEKLNKLPCRKAEYEQLQNEVDQSSDGQVSLHDPDAKMVIKHRNITEVGYNIEVVADSKHSLIVDVFAGGVNDMYEFGRAARRTQEILERKHIDMLGDKGYHNGVEIAYAERRGVRPFISPKGSRAQKEVGFRKQDFKYDTKKDVYICPAGEQLEKELEFWKGTFKKPYLVDRYGTPKCQECSLRSSCTTAKQGRKIERPIHQVYIDRNNRRVARYNEFYRLRQQIIEHVFGTWKRHWGLTYTLLRGKEKVETEYRLAAICYNLSRSMSILGLAGLKERLSTLLMLILNQIWLKISRIKKTIYLSTNIREINRILEFRPLFLVV